LQTPRLAAGQAGGGSRGLEIATVTTVVARAADFDEFERAVAAQRTGGGRFG
jgi:hypothetical protein